MNPFLLSILFFNNYKEMINKKYKTINILKQREYKITQKAIDASEHTYILKSYDLAKSQSISNQIKVYQKLKQPHLHGFPEVIEAFQFNGRLGMNIDFYRIQCGGRLSLKTVLMLSVQMLERIKYLHDNGFLHGDIKPDNFLMGKGKFRHKVNLIDFQLSHSYLDSQKKHIKKQVKDSFSGSLKFCSINANSKSNISRKDQLESLLYNMIFLLKGQLPWSYIQAQSLIDAYQQTCDLKKNARKQLLQGLPQMFKKAFMELQEIKYEQAPNYNSMKQLFLDLMKKNGYEMDYKYDWEYM